MRILRCTLFIAGLCLPSTAAHADSTPSLIGALGLNVVPSARMDAVGTVRAHAGTSGRYHHGSLGMQLAEPFYLGLRQTAESASVRGPAERLYPGADLKLMLLSETARRPAVAIGMQSAVGHRRLAGEYLVLSKRYEAFDFSAGLAWGQLGGGQIRNPLRIIGNRFGRPRDHAGNGANGPSQWFTGNLGFFGGIEYHTALSGLSLKADWSAAGYTLGAAYSPRPWVSIGGALVGGDTLLGTISFQTPVQNWPGRKVSPDTPPPMHPYRSGTERPKKMAVAAAADGIVLDQIHTSHSDASARLAIEDGPSLPRQAGRAARHMANHGGKDIEQLTIRPVYMGLEGPSIRLLRADLERAIAHNQGSPEEIWRRAEISAAKTTGGGIPGFRKAFSFMLDQRLSLSEEDQGILYRTGLIAAYRQMLTRSFFTGGAVRLDLVDNLPRLRNGEDLFADTALGLDRAYMGFMRSLKTDLHVALGAGYLEERYAGLGGEILYRPFGKTFAVGAEGWLVNARNPYTFSALGLDPAGIFTGHVQGWYEIPQTDLTLQARIGRYLGGDMGGTLALAHRFTNGVNIEAFVTATNQRDTDLFGGSTHLFSGVRMHMPIGNAPYLPPGSAVQIKAAPFGRTQGQALDTPLPLYGLTEPLSWRHITRHWNQIVQ